MLAQIEERGQPDPAEVVAEVGDASEPVDLVEGTGEAVIPDGAVEVHYSVINPADSTELESSWAVGAPVPIPIAQVFPGFADAMDGMLVGGRRAFRVPAVDVVGDPPPEESGLTAEDDVVFVVDLVSVSESLPGAPESVEPDEDAAAAAEERGAPDVEVPEGDAETEQLIWIDDVVGEGDVVCPGDTVLAHYTGIQASDGEQFDSSWERGEPSEFSLDGVIQGWTEGLVGMKVGGRRTLVIPPDLAYGDESTGGSPSGVLVFTVDLIGVS
ncbi:MAG: FKBP-type peptidyl-prolyl cis-trans isomerase [Microthrixaceae bacterium]